MSNEQRPPRKTKIEPCEGSAGGCGSPKGIARILGAQTPPPARLLPEPACIVV